MYDKLGETEYMVLDQINGNTDLTQKDLSWTLELSKKRVSKSLCSLEKLKFVKFFKRGKYKFYNLNNYKKNEVNEFLLLSKYGTYLFNSTIYRFHNIKLYCKIKEVNKLEMNRYKFKKYYINNQTILFYEHVYGNVRVYLKSNVSIVFLYTFVCREESDDSQSLQPSLSYSEGCIDRFRVIREDMSNDGITLYDTFFELTSSTALLNPKLIPLLKKIGLRKFKNAEIDKSWGIWELEFHGKGSVDKAVKFIKEIGGLNERQMQTFK